MSLLTILAASSRPVTLGDMMARLRLDETVDADQLEHLEQMISDAVSHIERESGVTLAPTDFEQRLDCWPIGRRVLLEASPVRGVDSVIYVDTAGDEVAVDPADYEFVDLGRTGALYFRSGFDAPALVDWPGAVRIRFAAGYNDPAETGSEVDDNLALPGFARQAVMRLAARWFVDREGEPPAGVDRAIDMLRVYF